MKVFEREIAGFAPEERQETMELLMDIEIKAIDRGLHEGKAEMALRQIRKRFGLVTEEMAAQIERLSSEQLNELGEALIDFADIADLKQWLARR